MQSLQSGAIHHLYFEIGDEVVASLTQYCQTRDIQNARISGIGALRDIELGIYQPETKSYRRKVFTETHELLACQGNVTLKDGKPFPHIHVIIGNHDFNAFGGHLFNARVAVVGEFILEELDSRVHREMDPKVGFPTWCLTEAGKEGS